MRRCSKVLTTLLGAMLLAHACMGGPTPTDPPNTATYTPAPGQSATPSSTAAARATETARPGGVTLTGTATRSAAPAGTATATEAATPTRALIVPTATEPMASPAPTIPFTATPAPAPNVSSLVVSPSEPSVWLAVISGVLYRTGDRGLTWSRVSTVGLAADASPVVVAVDYRNPEVQYLATSAGLYRRTGDGDWAFVHSYFMTALAVDMVDSSVLWAGVPYSTGIDTILVRSDDGGRTWGRADSGLARGYGLSVGNIAIDPQDPNMLFVSVRDSGRAGWPLGTLYRGARNGYWQRVSLGRYDIQPGEFRDYCSVNGLAYDPDLRHLYVGCDQYYYNKGLLFLVESRNAYAADASTILWDECSRFGQPNEYGVGSVRPLAFEAREPRLLLVSLSQSTYSEPPMNQLLVSRDGGVTWVEQSLSGLPR